MLSLKQIKYREIDLSDDDIERIMFSRIDFKDEETIEEFCITKSDGEDSDTKTTFKIEIKEYPTARFLDGSGKDYWLGEGVYKSSRNTFITILNLLFTKIEDIKGFVGITKG